MIRSFRDQGTEDVFDGADTAAARKACPRAVWPVARRKLDQLNRVRDLRELAIPPGNRLARPARSAGRAWPADAGCPVAVRRPTPAKCCWRNSFARSG